MKAHASPKADPAAAAGAAPFGEAADQLVVVGDDQRDHRDDEGHRREQEAEVTIERP